MLICKASANLLYISARVVQEPCHLKSDSTQTKTLPSGALAVFPVKSYLLSAGPEGRFHVPLRMKAFVFLFNGAYTSGCSLSLYRVGVLESTKFRHTSAPCRTFLKNLQFQAEVPI